MATAKKAKVKNEKSRLNVLVRPRPLLAHEQNTTSTITVLNNTEILVEDESQKLPYAFDHVFSTNANNEEIYEFACKPLLMSTLAGNNGSLIMYGQTGSGKSHTMLHEGNGVIVEAIRKLFQQTKECHKYIYNVAVSFVQIYQDKIYDLLCSERMQQRKGALSLKEHPREGVTIDGLVEQLITNDEEGERLFRCGKQKMVATNKGHHMQNRSHVIFIIHVEKIKKNARKVSFQNAIGNTTAISMITRGKLFLCDLAGSERLNKPGISRRQLEEARYINTSLLELGNVIHALISKSALYVPFRNSTLTRLLKDSLGGNGRANLMVCISPSQGDILETKYSLNFGQRAMKEVYNALDAEPRTDTHWLNYPLFKRRKNRKIDYRALAEYLTNKLKELENAYNQEKENLRRLRNKLSERARSGTKGLYEESSEPDDEKQQTRKRLSILLEKTKVLNTFTQTSLNSELDSIHLTGAQNTKSTLEYQPKQKQAETQTYTTSSYETNNDCTRLFCGKAMNTSVKSLPAELENSAMTYCDSIGIQTSFTTLCSSMPQTTKLIMNSVGTSTTSILYDTIENKECDFQNNRNNPRNIKMRPISLDEKSISKIDWYNEDNILTKTNNTVSSVYATSHIIKNNFGIDNSIDSHGDTSIIHDKEKCELAGSHKKNGIDFRNESFTKININMRHKQTPAKNVFKPEDRSNIVGTVYNNEVDENNNVIDYNNNSSLHRNTKNTNKETSTKFANVVNIHGETITNDFKDKGNTFANNSKNTNTCFPNNEQNKNNNDDNSMTHNTTSGNDNMRESNSSIIYTGENSSILNITSITTISSNITTSIFANETDKEDKGTEKSNKMITSSENVIKEDTNDNVTTNKILSQPGGVINDDCVKGSNSDTPKARKKESHICFAEIFDVDLNVSLGTCLNATKQNIAAHKVKKLTSVQEIQNLSEDKDNEEIGLVKKRLNEHKTIPFDENKKNECSLGEIKNENNKSPEIKNADVSLAGTNKNREEFSLVKANNVDSLSAKESKVGDLIRFSVALESEDNDKILNFCEKQENMVTHSHPQINELSLVSYEAEEGDYDVTLKEAKVLESPADYTYMKSIGQPSPESPCPIDYTYVKNIGQSSQNKTKPFLETDLKNIKDTDHCHQDEIDGSNVTNRHYIGSTGQPSPDDITESYPNLSIDSEIENIYREDTRHARRSLKKARHRYSLLLQQLNELTKELSIVDDETEESKSPEGECYDIVLKFKVELEEELEKAKRKLNNSDDPIMQQEETLHNQCMGSAKRDNNGEIRCFEKMTTPADSNKHREMKSKIDDDNEGVFETMETPSGTFDLNYIRLSRETEGDEEEDTPKNSQYLELCNNEENIACINETQLESEPKLQPDTQHSHDVDDARNLDIFDYNNESFKISDLDGNMYSRDSKSNCKDSKDKGLHMYSEKHQNENKLTTKKSKKKSEEAKQYMKQRKLTLAAIENAEIKKELLLTKLEKLRLEAVLSCVLIDTESNDMTKEFQQLSRRSKKSLANSKSTLVSAASCAHLPSLSSASSTFQSLQSPIKKFNCKDRFYVLPDHFSSNGKKPTAPNPGSLTSPTIPRFIEKETNVANWLHSDVTTPKPVKQQQQKQQQQQQRHNVKFDDGSESSSEFEVSSMSDIGSPLLTTKRRMAPCGRDKSPCKAKKDYFSDTDDEDMDGLLLRNKKKKSVFEFSFSCFRFLQKNRKQKIREKIKDSPQSNEAIELEKC